MHCRPKIRTVLAVLIHSSFVPSMSPTTKNVIIAALALLAIILGWRVYRAPSIAPSASSDASTTTPQTATSTAMQSSAPTVITTVLNVETAGESVDVADQPAGDTVLIAHATLTRPTWIAVKDPSGRILGAGRFDTSADTVVVHLLRATESGSAYQAVLYADNGDKQFDFHTDSLIVNAGIPVNAVFTVTAR